MLCINLTLHFILFQLILCTVEKLYEVIEGIGVLEVHKCSDFLIDTILFPYYDGEYDNDSGLVVVCI